MGQDVDGLAVDLPDPFRGHDLRGSPCGDHPAPGEQGGAIPVGQCGVQIVQDERHGRSRVRALAGDPQDVLLMAQVEGGRGLVQQQDADILCQHARQSDARALTARERAHGAVAQSGHVGRSECRIDEVVVSVFSRCARPRSAPHPHYLFDGEGEGDVVLLQENRPLSCQILGGNRADGSSVELDRSGCGNDVPRKHSEQCRLAGAIGSDERVDLSRAQFEAGVLQDRRDAAGQTQGGASVAEPGVRFAEFTVPSLEVVDGAITLDAVPATLTDAGAAAFGTYPRGEELDPISAIIPVTADCLTGAPAAADEPVAAVEGAAEDVASTSDPAPVWPWIAGGVGLLAVIVVAGVLIGRRGGAASGTGVDDD